MAVQIAPCNRTSTAATSLFISSINVVIIILCDLNMTSTIMTKRFTHLITIKALVLESMIKFATLGDRA